MLNPGHTRGNTGEPVCLPARCMDSVKRHPHTREDIARGCQYDMGLRPVPLSRAYAYGDGRC